MNGEQEHASTLLTVFTKSIDELDEVFRVSTHLRQHFAQSLEGAIKAPGLSNSQTNILNNAKLALEKVKDSSIAESEAKIMGVLYKFAITSIVSIAEQLVKTAFENLVIGNIGKLDKPERFTLTLEELKHANFKTDSQFWAEQIINDLHGSKNPQEKLNFQNIKAIESLFRDYFGMDFREFEHYDILEQEMNFFYQVRHILVHNGGYIDKRFINNIKTSGSDVSGYKIGNLITVSSEEYAQCKDAFNTFFALIELLAEDKGLEIADASI